MCSLWKNTEITFSPQHDEYSEHAYFEPLPAIATGCSTRTDGLLIFPQICIRRNFNRVLFWGGQRLNCKDSESLSLLISLPCCPYDQELWVTTNRMRCQPSHRNKMFTWQVSGNCTFNLYMLYVSYPHFYKLCHITRRLQVFELIFMSEGEGGCWWRGGWTWHLTSNRPLFETAFFFFYKKFFFWPFHGLIEQTAREMTGNGMREGGSDKTSVNPSHATGVPLRQCFNISSVKPLKNHSRRL